MITCRDGHGCTFRPQPPQPPGWCCSVPKVSHHGGHGGAPDAARLQRFPSPPLSRSLADSNIAGENQPESGRIFRPTAYANPGILGSIFHRRPSPSIFAWLFLCDSRSTENVNPPKGGTMSRDLERLIESVITDISCYGDLGE